MKRLAPALAAGLVLALIGAVGLAAGVPCLFPSLGPTIAIQASTPRAPPARAKSVLLGHLLGAASGFAAIHATGAIHLPSVLQAGALSAPRVAAAALATAVSMALQRLLEADHPPAEATALLVSLGAIAPTARSAVALAAGVLLVALLGEGVRRVAARAG